MVVRWDQTADVDVDVADTEAGRAAESLAGSGLGAVEIQRNTGSEQVNTIADFFGKNRERLVEIAFSDSGLTFTARLWIQADAAMKSKIERAQTRVRLVVSKALADLAPPKDGEEVDATVERQDAARRAIKEATDDFAGKLYDAGLVRRWDDGSIGRKLNRENFVWLYGILGGALIRRFEELVQPQVRLLSEEGKVSPPASNGSGA